MLNLIRNRFFLAISALGLFVTAIIYDRSGLNSKEEWAQILSDRIAVKKDHLRRALATQQSLSPQQKWDLYLEEGIGLYAFKNGELIFWNNSVFPVNKQNHTESGPAMWLLNGMFLAADTIIADVKWLALTRIRAKYDLQNKYLKNRFADWLRAPQGLELSLKQSAGPAVTLQNNFLFSLKGEEEFYRPPQRADNAVVLFFMALLCFLLWVIKLFKSEKLNTTAYTFLVLILMLRATQLFFKIPDFLYESSLYNLRSFGNAESFFNGYLGDIIINALLFLWLVVCVYYLGEKARTGQKKNMYCFVQFSLLSTGLVFHNHLFNTLSANSTISFDFLNLFNLSAQTYIAMVPLVLVNVAIAAALYSIYGLVYKYGVKGKLLYLSAVVFAFLFLLFFGNHNFNIEKWWFPVFSLCALGVFNFKYEKSTPVIGLLLFLSSLISSTILNSHIDANRQKEFELFSYRLTERQDPILENEFSSLSAKIEKDQQLKNLAQFLSFSGDKEFLQLLKQNYFFGYFDRYNIELAMFDEKCSPLLSNSQPALTNEGFFEDQIHYQGQPTLADGLFFIEKFKANSRYIAKVTLGKNRLYVLLEPKYFEEVGTFPDLLLDESQQKQEAFRNYSYAVYRSGINNSMYGDFNYPVSLKDSLVLSNRDKAYEHHFFYPEENVTVVITTQNKNVTFYFTYNSYMFLFFAGFAYLIYLAYSMFFSDTYKVSSLTRRIQTTVILLLLLSIAAVGITSTRLVSNQFEKDSEKQLQEKTKTILSDLSGMLQSSDTITDVPKELIDLNIKKFAYVFNSEVSIFDNAGKLYLTSQPRLYDYGLAAALVNPKAFYYLQEDLSSSFCSQDKAGALRYQSLYTPVYNSDKKLLGFLNLPYFGKQSTLMNELSGIISTLLNVYVILFIVSILSGLVLAGYITMPLRILKQQMAKVSLGSKNEMIKWESDDEVGRLVGEYNVMIEKLEKSAGLLAKSERETAWREMARQVAHEIKNPLTPMKLNLQYLQHVIKNNPKDFEERFNRASSTLIEQIDALANIATEFGNFAKLPSGESEKINLAEVLQSAVALFESEHAANLSLQIRSGELFILANREQLIRIFNNLITNALQAIEEVKGDGRIEIIAGINEEKITIEVKDSGCGIPTTLKEKIFTPNFTTKSTGSGLGLAMVKNMLDSMNARIWFESEEGRGTSFYLEFEKL